MITLLDSDREFLVRDVSKDEVFQGLMSLSFGKCPGLDGFNAEFYKFFLNEIGDYLFSTF